MHSFYETNRSHRGGVPAHHLRPVTTQMSQSKEKRISSTGSSLCFGSNQSDIVSKSGDAIKDITVSMLMTSIQPKAIQPKTLPSSAISAVADSIEQQIPVQQVLSHYSNVIELAQLPSHVKEEALVRVFVSEVDILLRTKNHML